MTEKIRRCCEVCGNLYFDDGGDGFFYCTRCGSQAYDIIDTGVDDDDLFNVDGGIYSASQRRQYSKVSQPEPLSQVKLSQHLETLKTLDDYGEHNGDDGVGPAVPSDFGSSQISLTYTDYYSEIRLRYVMGVQVMIQMQCKFLVENFNISPLIVGIAGPIWLRLLAHEKVLSDEWADNVIHESESQTQGEIEISQPTGSNKTEPHNLLDFSKDLQSYLLYCKDVVFAGQEPAYDDHEEERIIKDLWDFYQSHKAGKASEDGKTDSHTCNHFHHSGSRHGCSSTIKESKNFRDDGCKCRMSRDDGDSNAVNGLQCVFEETALRQLKADMKENRFVYIRPRKNVKKKIGYIRYARKKDGAYLYAVHADYYILLRSCAKVAQVDVRTMHVGVLTFEKRLEMVERRIGFCLCKRLPDDFCEFCRDE